MTKEEIEEEKVDYPLINSIVLWLKIGAVAFTLLIMALAMGIWFVKEGFDNQRRKDREAAEVQAKKEAADLLQRQIDACNRDNGVREGQRQSNLTSANAQVAFATLLLGNRPITPEIQAAFDKFNTTVVKPFLDLADPVTGPFAPRDCSPETFKPK